MQPGYIHRLSQIFHPDTRTGINGVSALTLCSAVLLIDLKADGLNTLFVAFLNSFKFCRTIVGHRPFWKKLTNGRFFPSTWYIKEMKMEEILEVTRRSVQ